MSAVLWNALGAFIGALVGGIVVGLLIPPDDGK